MKPQDWINVAAIVLSPIVALGLGLLLQHWQAKRDRKRDLFRMLMTNRAARLDLEMVQALNQIDLEFDGRWSKEKAVRNARKDYIALLTTENQGDPAAQARATDRFVQLLIKMGRVVGYNFDTKYIQEDAYYPKFYGDAFTEQLAIRQGMAKIMTGQAWLPVMAVSPPPPPTEVTSTEPSSAVVEAKENLVAEHGQGHIPDQIPSPIVDLGLN